MGFKLLAVDLDGTLLRHDGSIHPDDVAAVARLQARGIRVTIVTGRLYSGSCAAAATLALSGPIACVDGSHIVDAHDGRSLYHATLRGDALGTLREVTARAGLASFLFSQDQIAYNAAGKPFAGFVSTWSPRIEEVGCLADHVGWSHADGITACVAIADEAAVRDVRDELAAGLGDDVFLAAFPIPRHPGHASLLVRAAGPSKGTAIEFVARHHGFDASQVAVVGDWINDLPMFARAGRSFAMGGTVDAVRAAATDRLVAPAGHGGGVAEAIARVWGD